MFYRELVWCDISVLDTQCSTIYRELVWCDISVLYLSQAPVPSKIRNMLHLPGKVILYSNQRLYMYMPAIVPRFTENILKDMQFLWIQHKLYIRVKHRWLKSNKEINGRKAWRSNCLHADLRRAVTSRLLEHILHLLDFLYDKVTANKVNNLPSSRFIYSDGHFV